ncbi:hypothetical protein NUW58_g277 [Xylaria curta]|uniref:Uncharacterized protein n=1 Tax=Xylaria curta TaxID=42375 RepID=A0ACC1PSS3_9PEZI|nr:hypothetical protein NUW58_g277 [Xylaria curta]
MNTTLPSDTLLRWPSQRALASFCALQDLVLRFLLRIAKILQHAETWSLRAFNAQTHTLYRMFPSEDISDYTRVDAQLVALASLAVLIFSHLRGYLGPHPLRKTDNFDNYPWLVRVVFRGSRVIKYVFSYLRIPLVIAYLHVANDQFEAVGDYYLLCLRLAILSVIIAI